MILNYKIFGKQNKGSKYVVCAREGGANTTFFLAVHFAKRNTKNCGGKKRSGESEGGQKFLPPNPFPFCPPKRLGFRRAKRAINFAQRNCAQKQKKVGKFFRFGVPRIRNGGKRDLYKRKVCLLQYPPVRTRLNKYNFLLRNWQKEDKI